MTQNHNESHTPNQQPAGASKKKQKHNKKPQHQPQAGGKKAAEKPAAARSLQDLASLVKMAPRTSKMASHNVRAPLPNLMSYKGDGEDHINISSDAKTDLGKLLCFSAHLPFDHPVLERFSSVVAFNYFIMSAERDDRMRIASLRDLRRLADVGTKVTVHGLWTMVFFATWVQVNTYPELVKAIKENTLPFDLYKQKSHQGMPVSLFRPETHDVWLEIAEGVSKYIKSGKPPVFRGSDYNKMMQMAEEFAALGRPKVDPKKAEPKAERAPQEARLLAGQIDRMHDQLVDGNAPTSIDAAFKNDPVPEETKIFPDIISLAREVEIFLMNEAGAAQKEYTPITFKRCEREYEVVAGFPCRSFLTSSVASIPTNFTMRRSPVNVRPDFLDVVDKFQIVCTTAEGSTVFTAFFDSKLKVLYVARYIDEASDEEHEADGVTNVTTNTQLSSNGGLPENLYASDVPVPEVGDTIRLADDGLQEQSGAVVEQATSVERTADNA